MDMGDGGNRIAVRWIDRDNDSSGNKYIMAGAYIFDGVYERGPAFTKIYGVFIIIYMIYANIGDS